MKHNFAKYRRNDNLLLVSSRAEEITLHILGRSCGYPRKISALYSPRKRSYQLAAECGDAIDVIDARFA